MKIFTKKNSEGNKTAKFVGAYVPTNLYVYLTLYGIVNGTSKTEVLNSLLDDWYNDASKNQASERELIKETVELVLIPKWEDAKKRRIKSEKFIVQITEELSKQGFDETFISNMIKIFRHDTKQ